MNNLPYNLWRGFLSLTILLVLFFPFVSPVEVTMNSQYAQGETLLARFSGNFVDQITENNVFFCRGTNCNIPMTSDVVRIADDFYVYALLTEKNPGNYSIRIEGVRYYKTTQRVDDDIVSNFTISNETAAFSVNPGALTTPNDFTIELQNLQDARITVSIDKDSQLLSSPSSVELNTRQKKVVSFALSDAAPRGLTTIGFTSGNTSYSMPVYVDTANTEQETNETGETGATEDFDMEFRPRTAEVSMATNSDAKRILYLKNTGTETLEDISFNISSLLGPYVAVSSEDITSLSPGEIEQVELEISSGSDEAIIEGRITAYTENVSAQFILTLNLTEDFTPVESEAGEDPSIVSLCEDLGGIICADDLECSGEIKRTKNGDCCVAPLVCQEPKRSSSKTIIGWGLLILVFIIIIWFFKRRYRRVIPRRPF